MKRRNYIDDPEKRLKSYFQPERKNGSDMTREHCCIQWESILLKIWLRRLRQYITLIELFL